MRFQPFVVLLCFNCFLIFGLIVRFQKKHEEAEKHIIGYGIAIDTIHTYKYEVEQQYRTIANLKAQNAALAQHKTGGGSANKTPLTEENKVCRLVFEHTDQRTSHKLAVLIPYRDRAKHLGKAVPQLVTFLSQQTQDFDVFIIEQSNHYRFNRGALLNAGVLLLNGSDYDYFAFQDVDTLPTEKGKVPYSFPKGQQPLHVTPPGIHPKVRYEDFFGGVTIFTPEQMLAVNGYGINFWGWGKEDDNMRERLKKHDMWPPEVPAVPKKGSRYYFTHQVHKKAPEVRMLSKNGSVMYYDSNPDVPFGDAKIISAQPDFFDDFASGLNTTRFRVNSISPLINATKITVELYCDEEVTPWCKEGKIELNSSERANAFKT